MFEIRVILSLLALVLSFNAFASPHCQDVFTTRFKIQQADRGLLKDSRVYHVWDKHGWFYFKAKLEEGQVNIKANLVDHKEMVRSSIRGASVFSEMMEHFGKDQIDVIQGRWFPFSQSNYKPFKQALNDGHSMEEAAFLTWTGAQAKKHGYTHVEVSFELVRTMGFDFSQNKFPAKIDEYVKANFYKTKPTRVSQKPKSRSSWILERID